jgi:hypothetical protein
LYKKILIAITILSFSLGSNFLRVSEFKGLDTKTAPDKIQQNRATDITNLDFNVMGSLQTRRGIEYLYTYPDNIRNINDRAVNNMIYDNSIEYKGVVGSYNVNQYTNIGDDIYFFGSDMVMWKNINNMYKSLGYDSPISMNATVEGVTGNLNGTYNYAITYLYGSDESNPFYLSDVGVGGTLNISEKINFTNGNIALDLGDNKKFYMQTVGGVLFGYYIENDTVSVKRELSFTGTWIWQYYEDGYLYLVTREGSATPYTYRYYKINISEVQIENQASDVFTRAEPLQGEPVFCVYNQEFYIALLFQTDFQSFIGHSLISAIYKRGGNLSSKTLVMEKAFDLAGYTWITGSLHGMYVTSQNYYVVGNYSGQKTGSRIAKYHLINLNEWKDVQFNTAINYYQTIVLSGDYFMNYNNKYINWDNINGVLSSNALYFSVNTTNKLQSLEDNVWKEYTYNISTPTINLTSSNVWDIQVTKDKVIAINQKMLLSLPALAPLATGINIYRQWNGTGYYFLDNLIAGNTTYLDNIGNLEQSVVPVEIDNNSPPPAIDSEYIVARQFYLAPDGVVWYSKINRFESVPQDNYIRIRTEADDRPTRIIEHFGGLLVFFQKSVWYIDLQSASPLLWIPRKLNTDFGCPYPFSVVKGKLPNQQIGVFYMAEDRSVRVLTGIGSDGIQLFDNIYTDKVSLPIDDIFKNDQTPFNEVYFTFYDYKLYISLQNYLLIWDAQFSGEWTKYNLPINQRYVGVVDGELNYSEGSNLYKHSENELRSIIINGEFRRGLQDWELYKPEGINLINGGVQYNNSSIYQEVSVPTDATYYLYVEYQAEQDDIFISTNTLSQESSGFFVQEVSGDFVLHIGEKPNFTTTNAPINILFGYNLMSVISGDSMKASEIIDYLIQEMGYTETIIAVPVGCTGITSMNSKLYATVQEGSIYESADDGATWTDVSTAGNKRWYGISSITGNLYANVFSGSIWKSTDNAVTWTDVGSTNKDWVSLTSLGTGLYATVVGLAGILRSTDGGVTWVGVPAGNKLWLGITTFENTLYAHTATEIWKSTDGTSWSLETNTDYMYISTTLNAYYYSLGANMKKIQPNISDIVYFVNGVQTQYSTSGDATLNYGEAYYIDSVTRNAFYFNPARPERVTINFVTGDNYILGYHYKQYTAKEFLDKLEYASQVWLYDRYYYSGWTLYTKGDSGTGFQIGGLFKDYGLKVVATESFTMVFEPAKGVISSVKIIPTKSYDVYYDFLSNEQLKNTEFDGLEYWEEAGFGGVTINNGLCVITASYSYPFAPPFYKELYQTIDIKVGAWLYIDVTIGKGSMLVNNIPLTSNLLLYISPDVEEIRIKLSSPKNPYLVEIGEATINYITLKYDESLPVVWNYKTKVFGDSFEYYQDFDKIWLRGIQKTTSDVRIDYTCNNDLGFYADYILMNLYGDSIVNTGVNSLLGAGGRDIQLEFSGDDYIRLDAFSIKRTLREE